MQNAEYKQTTVAVIGGGAAGLMAAGTAVMCGASVTLFEGQRILGKKLAITGKGRCNVTNNTDIEGFLQNVTKNPRFLYAALNTLSPSETISFFESLGVKLKTERGNRVFPESDKAIDIVKAMRRYAEGAEIVYKKVKSVEKTEDGFLVRTDDSEECFDKLIIATGGRSYPLTGSDGSGYRLARSLGHTVTRLIPSLVPLESDDPICCELMGLSLRNVGISIKDSSRTYYEDFGEMMFTHFGVTGPTVLSGSAHLRDADFSSLTLYIDLKPALDEKTLDQRLLSDFGKNSNKDFLNSLSALLPSKLIDPFVRLTGIDGRKKVNLITKEERSRMLSLLKGFPISLSGFRPIEEAIVTSGGVEVKEVSPKTMESKIAGGLYFAGEVLDLDAYTGGFNLQIAFSTGYLAGKSAAEADY